MKLFTSTLETLSEEFKVFLVPSLDKVFKVCKVVKVHLVLKVFKVL